mgnify:CR=1 FL=1
MKIKIIYNALSIFISSVWLINGLLCKVLNLVPRHEQIVASILGNEYSRTLTILIGISEIVMAIWVLSGYRSRLNAIVQIMVVAIMNILEFVVVPNLLLWGRFNSIFALFFIGIVFYKEFVLKKKSMLLQKAK